MSDTLERATEFVWRHARLVDRRLFEFYFHGGSASAVLDTLRPYQNGDGGFGHALEPDLRTPTSQPVPTEEALHIVDTVGGWDDPMVGRACDWLESVANDDGGVPFVLPTAARHPHAWWWEPGSEQASSLNPTASLAGLLGGAGVEHPFVTTAVEWSRQAVVAWKPEAGYDARAVLRFLDRVGPAGERARVSAALTPGETFRWHPPDSPLTTPGWDVAPDVTARHLDDLAALQQDDGGWPIQWDDWCPGATVEWRGRLTVEALVLLRDRGRL